MGCFHPESSFADAKRENSGGGGHFCFHWREVLFYLILESPGILALSNFNIIDVTYMSIFTSIHT